MSPTASTKALLLWLSIVSLAPVPVAFLRPGFVMLAVLLAAVVVVVSLLIVVPPRRGVAPTAWAHQLLARFFPSSNPNTTKE